MKHPNDEKDALICGTAVLQNKMLAVTDHGDNCCIKVVCLQSKKIKCNIKLSSYPFDVTEMTSNIASIAVTCPQAGQIVVIRLEKHIKPEIDMIIRTDAYCRGIVHHDQRLITVCNKPDCVRIINECSGNIQTITFDQNHRPFFSDGSPRYHAIHHETENLYVTCKDGNIVRLNLEGHVISRRNYGWVWLLGIAVDKNSYVYLCLLWNDKICKLKPDLSNPQTFLDENIDSPRTISINSETLYVSHFGSKSDIENNGITVIRNEQRLLIFLIENYLVLQRSVEVPPKFQLQSLHV